MKDLLSRFLKYVSIDTQSDESSTTTPSTAKQFQLAEFLKNELLSLGINDITLTDKCYLYAKIPAAPGYEKLPAIGFIAHLDTSPAASGADVKVQIFENWDGSPIDSGQSGRIIIPRNTQKGHTIITTDGTTLLGADDKAGIAIIITAAAALVKNNLPHGTVCIGFTPDEEIGRGANFFDIPFFGADYAYTIDGGQMELIGAENFNAASANIEFKGVSTHPGSSKNIMVNAQKIAMEFDAMLPAWEVPSHTENREGFYHLVSSCGNVSSAQLNYILRDHDAELFEKRKDTIVKIVEYLNQKYGPGSVTADITDSYRNMAEIIKEYPFLIEKAVAAITANGYTPALSPIRGGTDGARLCFNGLPCPNLGDGGYAAHGETEYADVDEMAVMVNVLLHIINSFVEEKDKYNCDI